MAADQTAPTGLARPWPAMSGADPWTGSNIEGPAPPAGAVQRVTGAALDGPPREDRHLDCNLGRCAHVDAAAGARVFALGVLPDEQHVHLVRPPIRKRAPDSRRQPDGTEVHVLVERLSN